MELRFFLFIIILLPFSALAQDSLMLKGRISFSGYLEAFYSYDLGNPDDNLRPSFFYNHNRHNEVNINLIYLKRPTNLKG